MSISNQFGISRASSPGSVSDPRMGTISSGGPTFLAKLISDISVNAGKGPITVPTIGDSNGDRWGFNGSVWTETDAEQPRFYNGALYMEGSHTELSGYSGDIGNWGGGAGTPASVAQNAVGLRGNSSEAFTVTDSSNTETVVRQRNTTVANDSSVRYLDFWVKHEASPSVYPLLSFSLSGGTGLTQSIVLDKSDGTYTEPSSDGSVNLVKRIGDFWKVTLALTNNSTGNTTASQTFGPAYNSDGTTTGDITTQGSSIIAAGCLYKDSPSYAPILTTGGSTKTVNSDKGFKIPGANWPDGDVAVEADVTFLSVEAPSADEYIISPDDSSPATGLCVSSSAAKRLDLKDGTNTVSKTSAWASVGDTTKVKWIASVASGKQNLSADAVSATEGDYDDSYNPSGDILIGTGSQAMAIKNIKIYPVSLGDGWLGS